MQDILKDIVAHTHALGFLPLVKVTNDDSTTIESMAEDRTVVLKATTNAKVDEFKGTFGMPNLDKLSLHLKNPEYQKDAKIEVIEGERNGETIPTHIHFANQAGDFENDYRFMNKASIDEKLKTVTFKGATWDVEIDPSAEAIARMKLQAAALSEETVFNVKTEDNNLIVSFGDASSHTGKFTFMQNVTGSLKHQWSWPIAAVISILSLNGHITMKLSDQGAMMISVASGLATYEYILPAQAK
jgi:hypothetical protein